jgi:hypothetical protein
VALQVSLAAPLPYGGSPLLELGHERGHPIVVPPKLVAGGFYVSVQAIHLTVRCDLGV